MVLASVPADAAPPRLAAADTPPPAAIRFELAGAFPADTLAASRLILPEGLSVDFAGNIYVAESGRGRVLSFSPAGELLNVIGASGTGVHRFEVPAGVCAARSFTLFVADPEKDRVQVFDHAGNFAGYMPTAEGVLSRPWGVDLGPDGRLYIADRDNHCVVIVNTDGTVAGRLGSFGRGAGQLRDPTFVKATKFRVVVSDTGNHRLQLFDLAGGYDGEIGGGSIPGGFGSPAGIDIDADGTVFVADSTASRVVALDEDGHLLGEAGRGAGDPEGPEAPTGLAIAPGGRLYVADAAGGRIFVYRVLKDGPTRQAE